jgi:hypothetical protein
MPSTRTLLNFPTSPAMKNRHILLRRRRATVQARVAAG